MTRRCEGIEINPEYISLITNRLNNKFEGFDSMDPKMERVPRDLPMRGDHQENLALFE